MRTLVLLFGLLLTTNLFAQTIKQSTEPSATYHYDWKEIDRKIPGLSLKMLSDSSDVRVTRESFSHFDSTLFSLDIKDVASWTNFMDGVQEKVIPAEVRDRIERLGKEDTRRALSMQVIMEVERATGSIKELMLFISKEIFDILTDGEISLIYNAFAQEKMDTDLIEFRVLTAEQRKKVFDNTNADPLEIVPMSERKQVDCGRLSVPFLQLNMRVFFMIQLPPPC